ncbi:hypothetical protein DRQ32_08190 [bacterium]|nr:MAG: hypothetical protein DRQ32_08190 [bacterium]
MRTALLRVRFSFRAFDSRFPLFMEPPYGGQKMRATWFAFLLLLLAAEALAQSKPCTLDQWISVAETSSPSLIAADARVEAAGHDAEGAGNWPAPVVGYGWFVRPVETRLGPQEHKLSLTQALPVFGRSGLRSRTAAAAAEATRARRQATSEAIRYRLTLLWNELWLLEQSRQIAAEDLQLVGALHASALSQYRAGRVSQAAVVRIELELERSRDALRRQEDERAPLLARINAELGRGSFEDLSGGDRLSASGHAPPLESLRVQLSGNAGLAAARGQSTVAQSRSELASRERWPSLSIGGDYIFIGEAIQPGLKDSGQDAILLRAALQLPWPTAGASDQAARQKALQVAARADESALALQLAAELESVHFDYREASRRLELLDISLIPSADLALSVTRSSFAAGESSVGDLIEIRRTRLNLARELVSVSAERANSIARLELLVSAPFHPVEED